MSIFIKVCAQISSDKAVHSGQKNILIRLNHFKESAILIALAIIVNVRFLDGRDENMPVSNKNILGAKQTACPVCRYLPDSLSWAAFRQMQTIAHFGMLAQEGRAKMSDFLKGA
jgi:hypothetical protein